MESRRASVRNIRGLPCQTPPGPHDCRVIPSPMKFGVLRSFELKLIWNLRRVPVSGPNCGCCRIAIRAFCFQSESSLNVGRVVVRSIQLHQAADGASIRMKLASDESNSPPVFTTGQFRQGSFRNSHTGVRTSAQGRRDRGGKNYLAVSPKASWTSHFGGGEPSADSTFHQWRTDRHNFLRGHS